MQIHHPRRLVIVTNSEGARYLYIEINAIYGILRHGIFHRSTAFKSEKSGLVAVNQIDNQHEQNHRDTGDLAAGTMVIKLDNYHDMQVSLDEFSFLSDNYTPVYEQAAELSLNQVEIIRRTLASDYGPERAKRIDTLYNKVHSLLDIPFDNTPKEKFLYTLIRDYQHFALEEI